jgi:hypothetical protein
LLEVAHPLFHLGHLWLDRAGLPLVLRCERHAG